jgi:hypothetical protein
MECSVSLLDWADLGNAQQKRHVLLSQVPMRTMTVYGDHQAMITQPRNVAAGLLEMVYGLHEELAS